MKKNIKTFCITIGIILLSFLLLGIYPFGNNSIVVIDSNTQYVTFLSYLRTILLGQNDFKYTMSATLGQNFIPLLGYYLMSIFNILVIFFKPENMKILITILMVIKLGLCSVTMQYYLEKKHKKNNILFALCYGLMSYNIVFMYHIMWFDSIILFPIVILGIDKIFENKNPLLYIISLGLSIIFNYYIGFIICLASVMYFIYKFIFTYKKIDKVKVTLNYAISSLLGGMLSAFILLPSLLGLMNGKVGSNIELGFNISYLNVIAKTFTATIAPSEIWHGGPMIACSMFIVILVIMYFINDKISKKEKIINAISLLFLMTTFVFKPLNLLFHGLTEPNCFNYRHAFIFVFFMINLAFRSYNKLNINENTIKKTKNILILLSVLILIVGYKFNVTTYNISIFISLILGLLYIYNIESKKKIMYLVIIDLFINVLYGTIFLKNADHQYMSEYKNYVQNVSQVLDKIKDDDFYRIEKVFDREKNQKMLSINDSMIFGYNGISHFDSTTSLNTEILFEKLGQRRLITRAYYNENSTYLIDSLFGIKYILSYDQYKNYSLINKKNEISIYENPYYLSIGYGINNKEIELINDPFVNQNNILKSFSGLDKDVYIKNSYVMNLENMEKNDNKYIPNNIGLINIDVVIENDDNLYLYIPVNDEVLTNYPNVKVYINGEFYSDYLTKYEWNTLYLGHYSVGTKLNITIESTNTIIMDDLYLYYENIDVFEEHYNILKTNQVLFNKISSSYLKGNINLEKESKVIITIPYDDGWKIKVNGKNVIPSKIMDSLICLDLDKGINIIELKFTPKGLKIGFYISLISIIISSIYVCFYKKIWEIYDKFKEIINYIIVGALTTMVSLISYFILSRIMNIDKTIYFIFANTISWILSVVFAYITNKIFVFESMKKGKEALMEMIKFVSSRIVTYLIDISLMIVLVKLIYLNNDISKLLVQFIVLVLNYILSKLLVFKK